MASISEAALNRHRWTEPVRLPGGFRERDSVCELSCSAAADKACDFELSGLVPQLVPLLDFPHQLELVEGRVELAAGGTDPAGGGRRQVENSAAQRPAALVPLGGRDIGSAPALTGIIKRTGIDERPVEEIALRIVGIFVGVKKVDDIKPTDRQHEAIRVLRAGELIDVGIHFLRVAAEIDGLPHEIALHARIGPNAAELKGFPGRKSGGTVRVRQTEALIDLGVHP